MLDSLNGERNKLLSALKPNELNADQKMTAARYLAQIDCQNVKKAVEQVCKDLRANNPDKEDKSQLINEVQQAY